MYNLCDSVKRPNPGIMGTEEEKEVHAKGIRNIFNTVIAGILTNLNKKMALQVQESFEHQVDMKKTEPLLRTS
jgi:hypothetical protein